MKSAKDPRHIKRLKAVQQLFAFSFNSKSPLTDTAKQVIDEREKIDQYIKECAPGRPLEQINKTDLAVLRLSFFELIIAKEVPYKVVVDEAVELAKEFGSDSSPSFVNGVLGHLIKKDIGGTT